jgi:hypothetical protein
MWKVEVVAGFNLLSKYFPRGTEEYNSFQFKTPQTKYNKIPLSGLRY